jgi:hypothetical protein
MKLAIFLFLILAIGACKKDKEEAIKTNVDVQQFIQLLKSNDYDSLKFPVFTPQDIEALLAYRNETQIITDFPRNPISSLYQPECTLGMYVLWIIESIRLESAKDKMTLGFPSQNPALQLKNAAEMKIVSDSISQPIAAKAYFDWWENNKNKVFNQAKNIDPLQNTEYRWH